MDNKTNLLSTSIEISEETLQDIINIETGVLYPLKGFMNEADFRSVVDRYTLADGQVFTIPITLNVPEEKNIKVGDVIALCFRTEYVAEIEVEDIFFVCDSDWEKIFKTTEIKHPGVSYEKKRSGRRIGGKTKLIKRSLLENALNPKVTKSIFNSKGWNSIVGFQTRNPIHKAHEYIQRLGLEVCDGLFVNPIIGWKKKGDFTQEAVMTAYKVMIDNFYPHDRVYLAGLKTQMRYAGPREAIFHAIIRRNLGCTHFIIGRDHAGVGNYYGPYEAHKLARKISDSYNLGIKLLLTREPYYCAKCKQIVTDKTCSHYNTHRVEISGTKIRQFISDKKMPDETMMRREILEAILGCSEIFINHV